MDVVIVESPAKAKTINKYLGRNYEVYASYGHIRDLPSKDGSVDPDRDFAMVWDVDTKSAKRMADIARAVKDADRVILATDPDREGEAISWHVLEVLKAKKVLKDKRISRVAFNAITKQAVLDAMANPREVDAALVDAYLARRALDYLVGFNLSPVLWRKLPGARSAGRVQSVTLRLVCERELQIETFVRQEYWSVAAALKTMDGNPFLARLSGADGRKLGRLDIGTEAEARALQAALDGARFTVASVEAKPARRNPQPPFTTSTMQQEASRKLGINPNRTMQLAQRLYEGVEISGETVGLITYMRTDGVDMAPEAVDAARAMIADEFGPRYVPKAPRKYTVKAKNAQEAHEAVRPTDMARLPKHVSRMLDPDMFRLYELIWVRTAASQMESAELERTTVDIVADGEGRRLDLRATGQVIRFDGFLRLYQEGRDDPTAAGSAEEEDGGRLPAMAARDRLAKDRITADQHFTEPPPRFTEATIIKRMEELGIGRPSTYDATVQTLLAREYVRVEKKRLVPEDKGRLVTAFLESFFSRYVGYDFTADLEGKLDRISNHEIEWRAVLREFWVEFSQAIAGTKELRTTEVLDNLNEVLGPNIFPVRADGGDPRQCQACGGGQLSLKLGKFGAFIGCSNYPECKYTRQLGQAEGVEAEAGGPKVLGLDPASGEEVTLRDGRFGPYIQLGGGDKPKRSSLPTGLASADLTFDKALALLSLPREVARHPETKEPIVAAIGRYGPYVQHGKTYANLGRDDDVLTIGGNRAIDLVIAKESGLSGRRFGGGESPAKALGEHPEGGPVSLKAGRFGPYVQHGKINATLPKDADVTAFTLADAVALLGAKAAGGASGAVQGRLLGDHPDGGAITVRQGRFGPYVNHGKTNATLKDGMSPDGLTLEEAIRLVEDREGAGPAKRKPAAKVGATRQGAAKAIATGKAAPRAKSSSAKATSAKARLAKAPSRKKSSA